MQQQDETEFAKRCRANRKENPAKQLEVGLVSKSSAVLGDLVIQEKFPEVNQVSCIFLFIYFLQLTKSQALTVGLFSAGHKQLTTLTMALVKTKCKQEKLAISKDAKKRDIVEMLGRTVYLKDVAEVRRGPDQPEQYVTFGTGAAAAHKGISA